jgi:hypothetical protein
MSAGHISSVEDVMARRSVLTFAPVAGTESYAGQLACRHGETVGSYTPGLIPGTPGQAARRMLQVHQATYGCECTQQWWTYYQPGGAGWLASDDEADETFTLTEEPAGTPAPRWRYHHLIADADTDRTEKELERLSATGWAVVSFAIVPRRGVLDHADFVYLLRKPVPDDDRESS